jgi:hypothetical protein
MCDICINRTFLVFLVMKDFFLRMGLQEERKIILTLYM